MTESSSTPLKRWSGLGYQQVPGLANRIISRYLRAQRRNMLRFFTERGLFDLAERMNQIRYSRQGMLAKNRMFQKVLNEYSERATAKPATEAAPALGRGYGENLDMPTEAVRSDGVGADHDVGVPEVASPDGTERIVIEE